MPLCRYFDFVDRSALFLPKNTKGEFSMFMCPVILDLKNKFLCLPSFCQFSVVLNIEWFSELFLNKCMFCNYFATGFVFDGCSPIIPRSACALIPHYDRLRSSQNMLENGPKSFQTRILNSSPPIRQ